MVEGHRGQRQQLVWSVSGRDAEVRLDATWMSGTRGGEFGLVSTQRWRKVTGTTKTLPKDPTQEPSLGLVLKLIVTALAVFGERVIKPSRQRDGVTHAKVSFHCVCVCVYVEISNKRSPRSVSKMLRVKIHSVA